MSADTPLEIVFVGDVVGRPGREALRAGLARFAERFGRRPDLVVVNGENASGGYGLTAATHAELRDAGVDAVTLGNHAWDKREMLRYIEETEGLVRPLNYPEGTPGSGVTIVRTGGGVPVGVVSVMGRALMGGHLDCPLRAVEGVLGQLREDGVRVILVDVHAEATSEKRALGWHFAGRVSAVVGTHTHVQTADEELLPGGTAYLTDAGMTGPARSVIGMDIESAVKKLLTQLPGKLEVASAGPVQFNGVRFTIDPRSGQALGLERLNYRFP